MIVRTTSSSAASKTVGTVFFGIFAILGLVFTAFVVRSGFDGVRPWFWEKTDCVIESSAAAEKGDGFDFNVRYTYHVNGSTYTGTRFRTGMSSSMSGETAQRAALRYAAGTRATCRVNPSSPAESTLEPGSPWALLLVLFPLIFVAVGVGGIIAVWRGKPASSRSVSDRHSAGRGTVFIRLFGLIFICIGGGILYALFVRPMLKESAAAKWPAVPCEILSSRVASHRGRKGGSTYSVEIRYRYDFSGHTYWGSHYNFDSGSSSSRGWREDAVAKYPPGLRTRCYVNPDDPIEAVLSVDPSPDRWFGLIPGVFLVVGLLIFFAAPKMANRNASRTGLPAAALPVLPRDPVTGDVELRPAASPMTGCIVMLLFALFWNGIVWVILLKMPHGEIVGRIFVGLFALVGLVLAAAVAYQFLALFNPRPILTAGAAAIPLGGKLGVRWRFTGNVRRLVHLTIVLQAREEATYRRGTSTSTDRNIFAILPLLDTADRAQITGGSASVTIPRGLVPTFVAPNNKILWTLRVSGDIPKWPDVSAEFPITVLPCAAATLAGEANPAS